MRRLGSLLAALMARVAALPTGLMVVVVVGAVAVFAVGTILLYRTYEFVQHDNQFCLECHLMRDPFERFARSAHRELGCKACHRPNIIERSQMGLAQIIEQPDSIRVHAHVPNSVCAECHVDGDPERWRHIASTAGHRVHLESTHPSLRGLQCVECHATGVHEFAATERTCGQAGCHETTTIRLGRMADITIHCAACHEFKAPLLAAAPPAEVATALRPQARECLSCHQMRLLVSDLPADDPHEGVCGACHDPHSQETPRQAYLSCTASGCHAQPARLTPFHRGLSVGVLEECGVCHQAHDFRIEHGGLDCLACHSDPDRDAPAQRILTRDMVGFWHAQHRGVECMACHSVRDRHGAVTVTSLRDCRSCHHTDPVATPCGRCHERSAVQRLASRVQRTMNIRLGGLDRPERTLPFHHVDHLRQECQQCHTEGLGLSAARASCVSCHQEHHQPTVSCMACHPPPARGAHGLEVHLGCTGSGCHFAAPEPVLSVPRTRDFCLVCHQGLTDHRPGRNCVSCHALPRPGGAAGASEGRAP